MKIGDLVQFTNVTSVYTKWFYSHIGVVEKVRINSSGLAFCSVKWLQPVKYFRKHTSASSLKQSHFTIITKE